eukprot:3423017-Rhodomonas_salina.2
MSGTDIAYYDGAICSLTCSTSTRTVTCECHLPRICYVMSDQVTPPTLRKKYKKPHFQYKLYQECCFLPLSLRGIALCACYSMFGTYIAHCAVSLRTSYAMSGTYTVYAAIVLLCMSISHVGLGTVVGEDRHH